MVEHTTVKAHYRPAECYSACEDPMCPYSHSEGWICYPSFGLFSSEKAAVDAAREALALCEHDRVGGDRG